MERTAKRSLCVAAMAMLPIIAAGQESAPAAAPESPDVEVSRHAPAEFAGVWDYNASESLNAATGRPEQAPRSATPRGGSAPAAVGGEAARPGAGGASGPNRAPDLGPTPEMLRASRDLMRDLLEIPESLTLAVTPDGVTFTDDLDRARTYPTDGSRHAYRLGGSQFDARVTWRGSQLRKDIDGAYGFRMSEVYFLSQDAKRLFVILRVAGMNRNQPPVGADRVYDRVDAEAAGGAAAQ